SYNGLPPEEESLPDTGVSSTNCSRGRPNGISLDSFSAAAAFRCPHPAEIPKRPCEEPLFDGSPFFHHIRFPDPLHPQSAIHFQPCFLPFLQKYFYRLISFLLTS